MAQNTREQRKKKVIEVLNKARAMELQAITQYMNQHYNLDDMDYGDMAAKIKLIGIVSFDAKLEDNAISAYNQFLLVCRENGDSTSVKILEGIIDEEQIHLNYFDNVNDHIEKLGETYLAQIAGTPSATGLQTQGFVARQASGAPGGGA
jgi:bacterioferritin